jgi:hypothetical protein
MTSKIQDLLAELKKEKLFPKFCEEENRLHFCKCYGK